jgi:asparagine synthase (glutamine-hydrolysing)
MCSIAGIFSTSVNPTAIAQIGVMNRSMRHRGPDGAGHWQSDDLRATFGHNRLAIIDLSARADQPFSSSDGRHTLVFNGEIYNYRELRAKCEKLGSVFRTTSDTEVLLEMYRRFGNACWAEFRGMWATAIYDSKEKTLTLSRDHVGIKPLHYGIKDGKLFFASEIKALRFAEPSFGQVDETTVASFVEHGYLDRGPWTFFKNVHRFPAAHFAVIRNPDQKIVFTRYWNPIVEARETEAGPTESARQIRSLFEESVALHLESDVQVGACLSGGVDSSAIVCSAAKLGKPNVPLRTFTTEFPAHAFIDETKWARMINEQVGADATLVQPTYQDFIESFDRVLFHQDEPFGSTSIFSQYLIFQAIKKAGVKVVLDGQGADEVFAGYVGLMPSYLQQSFGQLGFLGGLVQNAMLFWRYRTSPREIFRLRKARFDQSKIALEPVPLFEGRDDSLDERLRYLNRPYTSFEQMLTDLVTETNLPQLLRYEDRDSMAHSIESRVPFLDPKLISAGLNLHASLKYYKGFTKGILREAFRNLIPEGVRTRVSKLGFPAPEEEWLTRLLKQPISGTGSKPWRDYVVERWRLSLHRSLDDWN